MGAEEVRKGTHDALLPYTEGQGTQKINVNLDASGNEVAIYGSDDGGTTRTIVTTNNGVIDAGTIRTVEATDSLLNSTATNIETFTNTMWQGIGHPTTNVTDDGDLQTVDTEAERMSVNPAANAAGASSVKYSHSFLLRWIVGATQSVWNALTPSASATYAITPYVSSALEASAVVKASAGNLYGGTVTANIAGLYFQVFNAAALPIDGTVPTLSFPLQSNIPFLLDTGKFANHFSSGIVVCISTTQFTKTIGGANALFYIQKS